MKTAIRWIILAATIGGGFTGVAMLLTEILHTKATAPSYFILWGLFMGFNLFAIVSGLLFADNPKRIIPLVVTWCLQTVAISSPFLVYGLGTGFCFIVGWIAGSFHADFSVGSSCQLHVLNDASWGIGVNVIAVTFLVLLLRHKQPPNTALEPTATAP